MKFHVSMRPDPSLRTIAQFVQQDLLEAGIELEIRQLEQAPLLLAVFTGRYQAAGWVSFAGSGLEAEHVFLVHSKGALAVDPRMRGVGHTKLPDGHVAELDGTTTWLQTVWIQR